MADVGFIKSLIGRMGELHLTTFAAGLAYGAVFSLVPMLVLLVTLLGVFKAESLVDRAMVQLETVLPADAAQLVTDQLDSVTATTSTGTFGIGAAFSVLVALWGASGAMRRVMEALNVVHRVEESRSFIPRLLVSILLAIGAIVILGTTVLIIVVGGGVAESVFEIIELPGAATTWNIVRWPILLLIAWLGIALAYRFAPASRQVGGLLTPGTLVATFGWVGFSALFSWYIGGIGDMSATWGSVAGIIVFLLYLQYTGLIVLLGALIDVQLWDQDHPPSRLRRWLHIPPGS